MIILRSPDNQILRNNAGEILRAGDAYAIKFGLLYNPYAVMDARNIAAYGWHVVNRTELTTLWAFEPNVIIGIKTKDTNPAYWPGETTNTNEFKLNIRNSGYRTADGLPHYNDHHSWCKWGADTWRIGYYAWGQGISYMPSDWIALPSNNGYSLHFIKDSTTLTHGQEGTYTHNNGLVIKTICIGTQEWTAEPAYETKFRTGEVIPEITDNAAWGAATGPALCALNNDWFNV